MQHETFEKTIKIELEIIYYVDTNMFNYVNHKTFVSKAQNYHNLKHSNIKAKTNYNKTRLNIILS